MFLEYSAVILSFRIDQNYFLFLLYIRIVYFYTRSDCTYKAAPLFSSFMHI